MGLAFGPRRGVYIDIAGEAGRGEALPGDELKHFEAFDLFYRSLCAILSAFLACSLISGHSFKKQKFDIPASYYHGDLLGVCICHGYTT